MRTVTNPRKESLSRYYVGKFGLLEYKESNTAFIGRSLLATICTPVVFAIGFLLVVMILAESIWGMLKFR